MQYGAPCHRSNVVFDAPKKDKIYVQEWPRNSPDLNPTENPWNIIKNRMAYKQSSSHENLRQATN